MYRFSHWVTALLENKHREKENLSMPSVTVLSPMLRAALPSYTLASIHLSPSLDGTPSK